MSVLKSPFVTYPVGAIAVLCILGVPALGADLGSAVTAGYSETVGILVELAPSIPGHIEEGRHAVDPKAGSASKS